MHWQQWMSGPAYTVLLFEYHLPAVWRCAEELQSTV